MSKYTYILDAGHGGLVKGIYQTAGKRSPSLVNGKPFYEGVNNREIVSMLIRAFAKNDISCYDCVASELDVPLNLRVARANMLALKKPCIYISIHSDAHGNGNEWTSASGMSIYTSIGQTKSDVFAELVINSLQKQFGETIKWRTDNTDKDKDKEENFYVLKETDCPAILCELGFHTNQLEVNKMVKIEFKDKIVKSFIDAIKAYEATN